ncbi:hypothetical protein QOT17_009517 [Balamuthia mandrillaris]
MRFFFTFLLALLALWLLASSTEAVSLRGFGCTGCNCEFVETTVDEGECQDFDSSPSASGRFYCEDGNIRLEVYQGTANCFSESSQTITVDEGESTCPARRGAEVLALLLRCDLHGFCECSK